MTDNPLFLLLAILGAIIIIPALFNAASLIVFVAIAVLLLVLFG